MTLTRIFLRRQTSRMGTLILEATEADAECVVSVSPWTPPAATKQAPALDPTGVNVTAAPAISPAPALERELAAARERERALGLLVERMQAENARLGGQHSEPKLEDTADGF